MQISNGTVAVTNGSAVVIGSTDVDWSSIVTSLQYGSPILFLLQGVQSVPRDVVACESPVTSPSGQWELTLASPWTGTTDSTAKYVLHKDFTLNLKLPIPTAGEIGWAALLARWASILDTNLGSFVPVEEPDSALTITVPAGKTFYLSNLCDIPEGVTIDILEGGTLEVG